MEHLTDFFDRYSRGPAEALVYDDGFRQWSYAHDQLRAIAEAFAGRLVEIFATHYVNASLGITAIVRGEPGGHK